MNGKFSGTARWLTALAVMFIPLSIVILISGSWMANFMSNQWTRYLLFASWISLTLSVVLGVVNMAGLSGEESRASDIGVSRGLAGEVGGPATGGGEGEAGEERRGETASGSIPSGMEREGYGVEQALMLGQASAFLLGLFLYVAFISWMILPKISMGGF
ncbi:MAG: hypothetical protein H5T72_00410 [Actinobacteria bacterium]|nr:hypothetical protein [Actinomycetota bacterium]